MIDANMKKLRKYMEISENLKNAIFIILSPLYKQKFYNSLTRLPYLLFVFYLNLYICNNITKTNHLYNILNNFFIFIIEIRIR